LISSKFKIMCCSFKINCDTFPFMQTNPMIQLSVSISLISNMFKIMCCSL
jgi:hypothetical protein